MNIVLIVSASTAGADRIEEWLGSDIRCEIAASESAARLLLGEKRYDLLIVNAPLPDGDGAALCARAGPDALILVPQAQYEAVRAVLEPRGVLTLPKPVSPLLAQQALSLLRAAHARVYKLERKLDEVRVIERAKWTLVRTLQMDEAQAHRYIEKQAMDLRVTRREVAERIIRTYEN